MTMLALQRYGVKYFATSLPVAAVRSPLITQQCVCVDIITLV